MFYGLVPLSNREIWGSNSNNNQKLFLLEHPGRGESFHVFIMPTKKSYRTFSVRTDVALFSKIFHGVS